MSENRTSGELAPAINPPPGWYWMLPASIAFLKTLPFIWLQFATPPKNCEFLGVSFIPKDYLAYMAFIRQVGDRVSCFFYNPFTTDPQTPRFILLFHWLLGAVCALTGLSANLVLELSRFPLLYLFFWMLWRFLTPIFPQTSDRLRACVLVGFSGGLTGFIQPFFQGLPPYIYNVFKQETQELYGWSTFAGFYNPLWIASMTIGLYVLQPMLAPNRNLSRPELIKVGCGFMLAYFVHPYMSIFILALASVRIVLEGILNLKTNWPQNRSLFFTLGVALGICLAVGHWQASDEVYRNSASGIFGTQNVSISWCPLTLGLVAFLAVRGSVLWGAQRHPYLIPIVTWVITVIFLETSPLIRGYKFVFLMHLPMCILAAPALGDLFARFRVRSVLPGWLGMGVVSVLLFSSSVLVTVNAIQETVTTMYCSADTARILKTLAARPLGNVLAPPDMGNMVPAFTADRVWVGQWFLTPHYQEKSAIYQALVNDTHQIQNLKDLLLKQHIRYFVVPSEKADPLVQSLGKQIQEQYPCGKWMLLLLNNIEP